MACSTGHPACWTSDSSQTGSQQHRCLRRQHSPTRWVAIYTSAACTLAPQHTYQNPRLRFLVSVFLFDCSKQGSWRKHEAPMSKQHSRRRRSGHRGMLQSTWRHAARSAKTSGSWNASQTSAGRQAACMHKRAGWQQVRRAHTALGI
jgi:hypothetical protein